MGKNDKKGCYGLLRLLCSRNARPGKALVERAQWEPQQAPPACEKCVSVDEA